MKTAKNVDYFDLVSSVALRIIPMEIDLPSSAEELEDNQAVLMIAELFEVQVKRAAQDVWEYFQELKENYGIGDV